MSQLDAIETAQNNLEEFIINRMAALESQLQAGPSQVKDTVAKVAEEFRTFRELVFSMFKLIRQQISECKQSIDVIETRHRRKALIFLGIKETDNENCSTVLLDLVHSKMALKEVSVADFSVCHRLGAVTRDRNRPILVRFNKIDVRAAVWREKSKLKGSPASVKEFLTKSRQMVFSKARQHFGVRACWTQEGAIVVKVDGSRHKFFSMDGLNLLIAKHAKGKNAVEEGTTGGNAKQPK